MSTLIFSVVIVVGVVLSTWAYMTLPSKTPMFPVPIVNRVTSGPYRWMKHPGYVGNTLLLAGLAGLAAGWWNALAIGMLAELLMKEWAWREDLGRKVN